MGLAASSSIYFDDVSLVQITDPDSTGLHVYDGYNSTDRGWASMEAGFDPIRIVSWAVYGSSFTSNITGLTEETKYYVRAYATNAIGTSYGPEINFTTNAYPAGAVTAAGGLTMSIGI